jgi:FAD synthase
MKVFSWDDLGSVKSFLTQNSFNFSCLTIGGFDGPHLGHEVLFEKVLSKKNEVKSSCAGVVTFARSPRGVKSQNFYKGDLSTLSQKIHYFEKKGFDFCLVINFDSDFKKTLGIDFFDRLQGYCNMKFLSVGQDFRCGYKGSMGVSEISEYFANNNLELSICNDVFLDKNRISSSIIRDFIFDGDIENAQKYLGKNYVLDCSEIKWKLLKDDELSDFSLQNLKKSKNIFFTKKLNQVTPQNAKLNATIITTSLQIKATVNFTQDGIFIEDNDGVLSENVFIEEIVL